MSAPTSDASGVVVRQFIDFHGQEVIEIETAEQWTAFPVDQVRAIEVQLSSSSQQLEVGAHVTKPVELAEPVVADQELSVDACTAITEDLIASQAGTVSNVTLNESFTTIASPLDTGSNLDSPAEGEGGTLGGGTVVPPLAPPRITGFTATCDELGFWMFSGRVTDDKSVDGLVVHFGGVLEGKSAVVNSQGQFQITVQLAPNVSGLATAVTTDRDGLSSNVAYCSVDS